jgi:WASH complex subunit strumpellin
VEELSRTLEGFRVSFEYISDYVSIYGLKIWQVLLSVYNSVYYSVDLLYSE